MLKRLIGTTLIAGCIATVEAPAAFAQPALQQHAQSSASSQVQLRDEIARMTSLSPKEIEVHATKAMIRVVLVNTGYNDDPPPAREYLASTVAALVNKNTETDARYKPIVVLHVEFVKKGLMFRKIIDAIEFRREANGAFVRHQT